MARLAAVVALVVALGPVLADDATAEQKKFAGTWKLKDGSADGLSLPVDARKVARVVFTGDQFSFKGGPVEQATTFTVDPVRGTIEIAPPKGETKIMRGRYRFDGGTLTVVLTDADKVPEALEGGTNRLLLVLERDK